MDQGQPGSIPFSFFVSLLHEISKIPPRKTRSPRSRDKRASPYPALSVLRRWIAELHKTYAPLQPNTTSIFFRLLFPEEDVRRKYDLQEARLASHLAKCFKLSTSSDGRGQFLHRWNSGEASGCLGNEIKRLLNQSCTVEDDATSPLSIAEVNELLDELAGTCAFSDATIRNQRDTGNRRSRFQILCDLYHSMTPLDASFLTQIILKDLRPLLYPASSSHYTTALTEHNSNSVTMLRKEDVMMAWDPSGWMLNVYRTRSSLEEASKEFENDQRDSQAKPQIGIPIEIPKSVKGRGCAHALSYFDGSRKVWAETKYDGERAQIHVEVSKDGGSRITIFSKSKRNSTSDRQGVHGVIRDALGLAPPGETSAVGRRITENIVLDAEMVAFSDRDNKIDEFWRIRSLVESTAHGVRGIRKIRAVPRNEEMEEDGISQCSLLSDASDDDTRHLALVFFDILVLDSLPLLSHPYSVRRTLLESVVERIPGRAMLADRFPVEVNRDGGSTEEAEKSLRRIFAEQIADHQEGVVIKSDEGTYNDRRVPWVKLKKDYIPNYGDTIDLVVVGAGWDKDRARELRVTPTTLTTFYIGVLTNADVIKNKPSTLPHFEVYFTVSYGMSREQLEEANFLVKASDPVEYRASCRQIGEYDFSLFAGLPPPTVVLRVPLLAELYGAGFTKAPQSRYYELRFPRITKLFRENERSWNEGLGIRELHHIAREAVGRDRSSKEIDDWCKSLWGVPTSPGAKSAVKRKATFDTWEKKLTDADEPITKKRRLTVGTPFGTRKREAPRLGGLALGSLTNVMGGHLPEPVKTARKKGVKGKEGLPVRPAEALVRAPTPETSLAKLLRNALVWFARTIETNEASPPWPPQWKQHIARESYLHSLEALLLGCGWGGDDGEWDGCEWAERGVIFVDSSAVDGKVWKEYAIKTLTERERKGRGKPIWVIDVRVLWID